MAVSRARNGQARVTEMMRALGDPQRVAILRLVHDAELPAGEIASHFKTTRQAVSQNLRVLANAGLVELRREGTRRLYRVRQEAFDDIRSFLGAFWDDRLDSLKREIESRRRRNA
jgi:DNA-binding transcriptional ArsR family regulator